jgi:hypothetical protein
MLCAQARQAVAKRRHDTSRAFQRPVEFGIAKVPQGRLNGGHVLHQFLFSLCFQHQGTFAWQEAYGAFSVSVSQLDKTIAYIRGQEAHHRKMTFPEEFLALLKRHRIEYDERYLWK